MSFNKVFNMLRHYKDKHPQYSEAIQQEKYAENETLICAVLSRLLIQRVDSKALRIDTNKFDKII